MKVTVNHHHAIALWRWNLRSNAQAAKGADEASDDEDEDDVCGICRIAYDGCCPDCKTPGDECPLIWGECTHVFHMHCLLKWINTDSSKQQCPMDRRPWVTAEAFSDLPPPLIHAPLPNGPPRGGQPA